MRAECAFLLDDFFCRCFRRDGSALRQLLDKPTIGSATNQGSQHLFGRSVQAFKHVSAKHLELAHRPAAQLNFTLLGQRLQRGVKMAWQNPAGSEIVAENFIGQVAGSSERLSSMLGSVMKIAIFETMERIMMDKRPHRPVKSNDLARKPYYGSELHPL